jgi:hypothetical protein
MSALPRDWAMPFLEQARADLHAANALSVGNGISQHGSTLCMMIQMVYEKLAKAAYHRGNNNVCYRHDLIWYLFHQLARHPQGKRLLSQHSRVQGFVIQLEMAHPQVAKRFVERGGLPYPQLEYPWENSQGTICWPEQHLSLARRVTDPKDRIGLDCLLLATALEKQLFTLIA